METLATEERFDLEERTAQFGERIITFAKRIPLTAISRPLISQLIRASTSIGANYAEASDAESRRDYRHKAALCKKESKESRYWLRMITAAAPELYEETAELGQEATELNKIFGAIVRKVDRNLPG